MSNNGATPTPDTIEVGHMHFTDGDEFLRVFVRDGTVYMPVYPDAESNHAEFDETDDMLIPLPSEELRMSGTEARILATMLTYAAAHADEPTGNGWTDEPCIEPDDD